MHEAGEYVDNSFVTLTLEDAFLPRGGSLDGPANVSWGRGVQGPKKPGAFALFMKRLREKRSVEVEGRVVRPRFSYFHSGEYGERNDRPHYHALLFGVGFADRVPSGSRGGIPVFRSRELEELWPGGRSEIGSVTFESAQYVAKYLVKRCVRGGRFGDGSGREPEYVTMSRRPGLGTRFVSRCQWDLEKFGTVMVRGAEVEAPRFYLDKLPELAKAVQVARRERKHGGYRDDEWRECAAREIIAVAKLKKGEEDAATSRFARREGWNVFGADYSGDSR